MDIDAPLPAAMEFTADEVRDFQGVTIDDKDVFCETPTIGDNVGGENLTIGPEQLISDESAAKQVMETDDSADAVPDTILTEMKEQILQEVEGMEASPSIAQNDDAVPDVDIDKLLSPKTQEEPHPAGAEQQHPVADETLGLMDQQPKTPSADPEKLTKTEIKAALNEIKSVDVLVCGNCHLTTNFIEEFTKHRASCKQMSPFVGGMIEQKPTIWAFLLYKHALVQQNPQKYSGGLTESSWKLYQKWCKMPEEVRNTWIIAGESVMSYVSMSNMRKDSMRELPSKDLDKPIREDDPKGPVIMKKFCQRDQSGGMMKIRPGGHISSSSYRGSISEDSEPSKHRLDEEDSQDAPPPNTKVNTSAKKKEEALREEEFVVERIVSRRFNPRRKQYEYLLKWEGYPPEQNTWEPAENLEACQHLLKAFEESLNKQAVHKMKNNAASRKPEYNMPSSSGTSSMKDNFGRPLRSSKQKALSQVKQWCGSIKPDDEIESLMKRKMSPADSDEEEDFMSKRFRMGSDSEESLGGRGGLIKKATGSGRGPGRPRKYPAVESLSNGTLGPRVESSDEGDGKSTLEILSQANVTKTLNLSPANQQVLVANAKGVVKVDPAQVPNLSSGVYIMSNKSGIIKLDSVSPSKALSMKQGVVKDISPSLKSPAPSPAKSVVMLNKNQSVLQEIPQKSGIVRKNQLMSQSQPTSRLAASPSSILPGAKAAPKPVKPTGNIKINSPNPNTRFLHSGANRSVTLNPTSKPKTIIRQEPVFRERMMNSPSRVGRGGILAGSLTNRNIGGARSGAVTSTTNTMRSGITKISNRISNPVGSGTVDKGKVIQLPKSVTQPPSAPSEAGEVLADMPQVTSASPSQSLTLCPETGDVLLKNVNANTDPSASVVTSSITTIPTSTEFHEPIVIKEEFIEKTVPLDPNVESEQILTHVSHQPIRAKNQTPAQQKPKESLVKRTLGKPGSIGSMTVSPKKTLPEIEDPDSDVVTISGDDGMIYKVSKSELNNSLLSAGDDQQCIYLTTGENGEENATVITLDPSSYSEQVNQLGQVNVLGEVGQEETTQYYVKDGEEGELMDIQVQGQEGADDGQSQLVAQLVEAGEPEPGVGTRKVVLLLPDGNLMMTEVDEEQYAALELDKIQGQTAEME